MAWWWNRKPQYDGLFDYQNHVRPAYFTFLLLSRLTGQRLELSASDKRVHGFATWDPDIRKYSVLFWNFSPETVQAHVKVSGSPSDMVASPERLDSLAPSDDENIRLKPLPVIQLGAGTADHSLTLEPYDLYFWELDSRKEK
jgi:hypothetical protein